MILTNISNELKTEEAKRNWFDYWAHFSDAPKSYCSEINCCNSNSHGAIVKKENHFRSDTFVIPLCEKHSNNYTFQIEVSDEVEMIPIDYCL
ncbi:hypothetical protein [Aliivibrio kagoshimensis]|jgi:hypothetical protein|uniref:hypothetical protein n=1 Tax=Aliivibrio kagoshimensis TaxID=2910230 RepID=UPI003D10487E